MNNNALSITNLIDGFRLSCQTEGNITIRFRPIAIDRSRNIDQQAGFPFAQPKTLPGMRNRQAFGLGL
jgi:hypothetical protein